MRKINQSRAEKHHRRAFTLDEMRTIFAKCPGEGGMGTSAYTGPMNKARRQREQRESELAGEFGECGSGGFGIGHALNEHPFTTGPVFPAGQGFTSANVPSRSACLIRRSAARSLGASTTKRQAMSWAYEQRNWGMVRRTARRVA
ncbi:MAG: hypothetical protein ABMA26_23530 [Limisphaerales bacterium]